jgi:hypothetical protein
MTEKELTAKILAVSDAQDTKSEEFLGRANVVGHGVGTKISKGQDTGEPCISVFVENKMPPDDLTRADRIPRKVGDIKTDIVETGVIQAGQEFGSAELTATETPQETVEIQLLKNRVRPAMGGYSVGHYRITAGTYGTAVYDRSAYPGIPRRYYILSNNHVLANSNHARIGDPILQPGPYDGGTRPRDTIARLSRWVTIKWNGPANYVDAAIAEGQFHDLSREIFWIGYVHGRKSPILGMRVQKTGRTTNYTTGTIRAVNATVNVGYGGGKYAKFVRQIVTTNMSAGGDSGSLLLDEQRNAVGLLFAGSSSVTIHNDLRYVEHLLGIRIH